MLWAQSTTEDYIRANWQFFFYRTENCDKKQQQKTPESFCLLKVNIFARNCQSTIQTSSCMGWLMCCLETAKVQFFPMTFLNLNFLTTSVLSSIKKSHLLALNLTHNLLFTLTYHILLLAASFAQVCLQIYLRFVPKSCVLDPIPTTLLKK